MLAGLGPETLPSHLFLAICRQCAISLGHFWRQSTGGPALSAVGGGLKESEVLADSLVATMDPPAATLPPTIRPGAGGAFPPHIRVYQEGF